MHRILRSIGSKEERLTDFRARALSLPVLGGLGKNHVYFLRMRGEMELSTVARKEAGYRHCVNTRGHKMAVVNVEGAAHARHNGSRASCLDRSMSTKRK